MLKSTLVMAFIGFLTISPITAQGVWKDILNDKYNSDPSRIQEQLPTKYRAVELDMEKLTALLLLAPQEEDYRKRNVEEVKMTLPMPDGTNQTFMIYDSPIMEPGLAAKFPNIKTYAGQGIDEPSASIRFGMTHKGFRAIVLSPDKTAFIEPFSKTDPKHYISFSKSDFEADRTFECSLHDVLHRRDEAEQIAIRNSTFSNGEELRVYRLACAATGEYTQFHGGTVADGMAAIVTSINRINSVYERDLSVRLILIDDNDRLVFTNPGTDNLSNDDPGTLLDETQVLMDTEIGDANYDIGHTLSTVGGGIAGLGVVCVTGRKAWGVTGINAPIGDPFDIDFVAHEMGHQFGGDHTFNGNAGACNGNRSPSAAYEPGSGTTIQAYAGICASQNIQNNSDDYFHTYSLEQMIRYTTSSSGNNCPTIEATNNTPPVAVHNMPESVTIPINTPFELIGSSTDADGDADGDGDAVTYNWEQFDLGPAGNPNNPSGNAPIFRSWPSTLSTVRTFPRLTDLLSGGTTFGERLPTYSRSLNFRLTVRDNRSGGGGVHCLDYGLEVDEMSGPFEIREPNNNTAVWREAELATVAWDIANTDIAPVSCTDVDILLSVNGGESFDKVLAKVPNTGESEILLPRGIATQEARIKVKGSDNLFFDISDQTFVIEKSVNFFELMTQPNFNNVCQGTDASYQISLVPFDGFVGTIPLRVDSLPIGLTATFTPPEIGLENDNSVLTISGTADVGGGNYEFFITGEGQSGFSQLESSLRIRGIINVSVIIEDPIDESEIDTLRPTIVWGNVRGVDSFGIEISTDSNFVSIVESVTVPGLEYALSQDLLPGTQYFIRISARDDCGPGITTVTSFRTAGVITNIYSPKYSNISHTLFPNPVNDQTTLVIESHLPNEIEVSLFNLSGQRIKTLLSPTKIFNRHFFNLDMSNLKNGIYYYEINFSNRKISPIRSLLVR